MSIFTSLGILLMVVLLQNLMQLAPGVFALFYHYAIGKNSLKKARLLAPFFVLGILITNVLTFLAVASLTADSEILRAVMAGILVALAVVGGVFYYRKGDGSELYTPRKLANALTFGARNTNSAVDAFLLGLVAGFSEIIFTIPLTIMVVLEVRMFDSWIIQTGLIALDVVLALTPFIVIGIIFRTGGNLADIARMRVRNKSFYRMMFCFLFILLAAGLYNFGIGL